MRKRRPIHPADPRCWPAWAGAALLWLLTRLPLRAQRRCGALLGDLLRLLAPRRRRIVAANLALCFPGLAASAREDLLRRNFRSSGMGMVESATGWWAEASRLDGCCDIEGMDRLQRARAGGRGVLLIGAHMTTLELAGCLLALHTELDVVYRPQKNPAWDRVIRRGRQRRFARLIDRADARALLRSLREGRVVWYLPDQDYGARHSVFAPFFGVPAATLSATARLARLTGAAVLPFAHHRNDGDGSYRLRIGEPLENYPGGDPAADAARVNGVVEELVRQHPEQYLWAHRRFKTRPPGTPGLYDRRG